MTSVRCSRSRAASFEPVGAERTLGVAPARPTFHLLGWVVLACLAAACVPARDEVELSQEETRPVWPAPPSPPRVELVRTFSTPSDLGIAPPLWKRVADLVTGAERVGLVRPLGVAATGARIAVADPGAGVVHLYDRSEGRARRVAGCGATGFGEPVAVVFLGERLLVSDGAAARIEIVRDGDCDAAWELPAGSRPAGLAVAPAGDRVYVADAGAHRILVYDLDGRVVSSFGRRGHGPGELNYPTWIAVDGTGDVYVTDALNFRVQIFGASGAPRGEFGVHGDGSGQLAAPKGIGVGGGGEVYLVDALFDAVQVFDRNGNYLMVFGERGRGPGRFWLPSGLAVDGERIYVADSYNQRIQIFRILEDAG